ncbi:hypothetical protein [Tritonibacter scottomollicae]|uniref:hypothetical protein n=1 Tax=Tritonibacter scottomollicae TaxID=483013 RepID=UPI003AA896E2
MAAKDDRLDATMLESMAQALRADLPFSFNRVDMAELLERCAARVKPGPAPVNKSK